MIRRSRRRPLKRSGRRAEHAAESRAYSLRLGAPAVDSFREHQPMSAGGNFVGAFAEHELEFALREEAPARGVDWIALKPEDIDVEFRRRRQVLNGEHGARMKE